MTRTTHPATAPLRKDYDLDLWRWRLQTLEDLTEFETKHGPTSTEPLPTLKWELGTTRKVCADLPNCEPQSLAVLSAFAAVHGRIGKPKGTTRVPRTTLLLRTCLFQDDEESEPQPATPSKPEAQGGTA